MPQQIINNGESGSTVRSKLNSNFTELYTGKDAVTVNTFADLPAASTVSGQRYWVLNTTGVYLVNRRQAGAYYSNGVTWTWLGDVPSTADQIGNVPAGAVVSTNVQAAINELDGDLTGVINNQPTTIRSQVESALVAGTNISITPSGAGATRQFTLATNFASQAAKTVLAAPNGAAGVPTFRALVAADIPTLNQNTTGSAATLTTGRTIGMTGDVTWTSASFNGSANVTGTATIANSAVTNAKMANVNTATFKGRSTAGTGAPEDLTATQATALLGTFTSTLKGLAPASGGGTANFLRADGTWAAPPGGGSSNLPASTVTSWYIAPWFTSTNTNTEVLAPNTIYGSLFEIIVPITVDRVVVKTGSANTTGDQASFAIYAVSSARPLPTGTPLWTSGTVTMATPGTIFELTVSPTLTLQPGLYFFAHNQNVSRAFFTRRAATGRIAAINNGENFNAAFLGANVATFRKDTVTLGTWPTFTGVTTDWTTGSEATSAVANLILRSA